MKKQIAKRLNIALDAADWEIMQRYMAMERVDQTQAIRDLLKGWEREKRVRTNARELATPMPDGSGQ
jgi:hypothetical protein